MRIEKFDINNTELYKKAFEIREIAFIKELNIDPELELQFEDECTFYLVSNEDNTPVATARYRETKLGLKIERFAVIASERNKGLGKIILHNILDDLKPLKKPIYLNSQIEAVNFYLRNGFEIEGPSFLDAGVVHHKMVFKARS